MLERIDPFRLKEMFDWYNFLAEQLGDIRQDLHFLRVLRRAFVPLESIDPRPRFDTNLFPPLEIKPHPVLAGKRVGLVASGGSGAQVALCGVKRALEEADIEVSAVSVCSGSAIWGSMIAAGFNAQQMVDLCLNWTPRDVVDPDWRAVALIPFTLGKGFAGLARGEAIENTLDLAFKGMTLSTSPVPYYAIVFNMDTNRVEYFGPHNRPGVLLARMARVAIALPLFVQPVKFGEHFYVDGGVVNIFPVEPLLRFEDDFDYFIGVNVIMPEGFEGEEITGWLDRPGSVFAASRQLYHAQWLELARREMEKVGDRMLLLDPLPYSEIMGSKFYEVFIDNSKWPEYILHAHRHTADRLRSFNG